MLKKGVYKIYYKVLMPSFTQLARYSKRREFVVVGNNYINQKVEQRLLGALIDS